MFMLQPGMGVRLGTYYRRRGDDDTGHAALTAELRSARAEGQVGGPDHYIADGTQRPPLQQEGKGKGCTWVRLR
jgi:hypothetical protein